MKTKTVILIAGPTASGKTRLSLQLARHFNTSIISADSRQCYREMTIGVAKPSPAELAAVPHYFINSHSIHEEVSAAAFEQYALASADAEFRQRDVVVMAGGTGLYIKAFCEGLDFIPAPDPALRQQIIEEYRQKGIQWLQEQVQLQDPLYFATGEGRNPQRLMRALEVKLATGRSIREFQHNRQVKRPFRVLKYCIALPKPQLHQNIHARLDEMVSNGLVEEVKSLQAFRSLSALQTVGYSEIFEYLDGHCDLPTAIEKIKDHTRQYAKRQLTWFRRAPAMQWIDADTPATFFEEELGSED